MWPRSFFFIAAGVISGHLSVRFALRVPVAPKPWSVRWSSRRSDVKKLSKNNLYFGPSGRLLMRSSLVHFLAPDFGLELAGSFGSSSMTVLEVRREMTPRRLPHHCY